MKDLRVAKERWIIYIGDGLARRSAQSVSQWVVQREKLKISHTTPLSRTLQVELAVMNTGPATRDFVMVLRRYLPGLSVTDGEGRELNYLPTSRIEEEVGPRDAFIRDLVGEAAYATGEYNHARVLWVVLPEEAPTGRLIILRLAYEDASEFPQGRGLIRRPSFPIVEHKSNEDHDTFIEVRLHDNARIGIRNVEGLPSAPEVKGQDGAVYTHYSRFLQVRAVARTRGVKFVYCVEPTRPDVHVARIFFAMLSAVPLAFLLAGLLVFLRLSEIPLGFTMMRVNAPDPGLAQNVALAGVAGILAVMGLVPPSQVNRAWYALPFALYLALLAWKF